MFPLLPTRAIFIVDKNIVSGTQKMFLIFFRNILCPGQMFFLVCAAWKHNTDFVSRACARPRNIMSNNVSATLCPRLPGPYIYNSTETWRKCFPFLSENSPRKITKNEEHLIALFIIQMYILYTAQFNRHKLRHHLCVFLSSYRNTIINQSARFFSKI